MKLISIFIAKISPTYIFTLRWIYIIYAYGYFKILPNRLSLLLCLLLLFYLLHILWKQLDLNVNIS